MGDFKNNIQIGIKIDPQNQSQKNLETIITKLNENKINLDLTIKGDASKQLENLSVLIDTLKSKMGGGISLGDLDKVINNSVSGLTRLNGELQKVSRTNLGDGLYKQTSTVSTGIGEIEKKVGVVQKIGDEFNNVEKTVNTTTMNLKEYNNALSKIEQAQSSLSNLKLVDSNKVSNLSSNLNTKDISSTNELNNLLSQVKALELEENRLKQIQKEELDLVNQMANSREKAELRAQESIKKTQQVQTDAINKNIELQAKQNSQDKSNMYKSMFDTMENRQREYTKLFDEAEAKELQMINQIANAREKTQINTKNNSNSDELTQAKNINQALEEEYKLKQKVKQEDEKKVQNSSNTVYIESNRLLNEEYSIKTKLITAEGQYKTQLEEALITNRLLQNEQNKNIKDNNLTNQQKEIELTNQQVIKQEQLNQTKAKNNTNIDSKFASDLQKQNEYLDKSIVKLNQYKQTIATSNIGSISDKNQLTSEIDKQINKINELKSANNLLGNAEKSRINESISGLKSETNALTEHQHGFMDMVKSMATMATTGALMYGSLNKLKEGTEWVKYLDESFTDMAVTMDISREQFDRMSISIDDMSKKLGVNAKDVHDIARVYANATASVDEILSKVKPEAMLSNISGINGESITKTVQATTYAFDLLNESESNAGQVTEHIGDILTNVSKNMKYDFQNGIVQLNEAIKTSGSVARESGMSLEQYSAYMGALIERTGKTGLIGSV